MSTTGRFPEAQQPVADPIKPRDIAFFHGNIDLQKPKLAEKLIVKSIKAATGDFRDWNAITTCANGIAEALK